MSRARSLRLLLLSAVCFASARVRAAGTLTGAAELATGGGYDSNPLLTVAPGADPTASPLGGWYARLAPAVSVGLSSAGHRLELSGDADLRVSDAFGRVLLGELELSYVTPALGIARVRTAAHVGTFDVSSSAADSFRYAGGELGARLELDDRWRLLADLGLEARRFDQDPAGAHTDVMHLASLRLPYRPKPWFEVGLDASATIAAPAVAAFGDASAFWRLRGGPMVQAVVGRWTATASAWAADVDAASSASRAQLGGSMTVRWWAWSRLDVVATALVERGIGANRRSIDDRSLVIAGVALHATSAHRLQGEPDPNAEEATSAAPVVRPRRVQFRLDADVAARAVVVGSWNDWGAATPLVRVAGTRRWQAWVAVPSGSHRYRFVVDGRAVRPEHAPRYAKDDFGGEDGVVDVPP